MSKLKHIFSQQKWDDIVARAERDRELKLKMKTALRRACNDAANRAHEVCQNLELYMQRGDAIEARDGFRFYISASTISREFSPYPKYIFTNPQGSHYCNQAGYINTFQFYPVNNAGIALAEILKLRFIDDESGSCEYGIKRIEINYSMRESKNRFNELMAKFHEFYQVHNSSHPIYQISNVIRKMIGINTLNYKYINDPRSKYPFAAGNVLGNVVEEIREVILRKNTSTPNSYHIKPLLLIPTIYIEIATENKRMRKAWELLNSPFMEIEKALFFVWRTSELQIKNIDQTIRINNISNLEYFNNDKSFDQLSEFDALILQNQMHIANFSASTALTLLTLNATESEYDFYHNITDLIDSCNKFNSLHILNTIAKSYVIPREINLDRCIDISKLHLAEDNLHNHLPLNLHAQYDLFLGDKIQQDRMNNLTLYITQGLFAVVSLVVLATMMRSISKRFNPYKFFNEPKTKNDDVLPTYIQTKRF